MTNKTKTKATRKALAALLVALVLATGNAATAPKSSALVGTPVATVAGRVS